MAVFLALTLTMCTKSEILTEAIQSTMPTTGQDRKALLNDIIGKTGDIRTADVTLRTTYTTTEAIDLIDEALNYAYCRPGTPLQETIILSDTLMLEVISSEVTETELVNFFDSVSLHIGTQYHDLTVTNKEAWAFSVNQFGSLVGNELPIIVQLEVAYGAYITEEIEYGETDDYSYHYGGGYCSSTLVDGAPEILRDNLKLAYVYNPPSTNKYFKRPKYFQVCNEVSSTTICEAYGIPNNIFYYYDMLLNGQLVTPQYWDNINDWKLFRQHESITNFDQCLSGDVEMPFCYSSMAGIVEGSEPEGSYYPGNIFVGSFSVDQLNYQVPFHNMVVGYYQSVTVDSNDEKTSLPCNDCE